MKFKLIKVNLSFQPRLHPGTREPRAWAAQAVAPLSVWLPRARPPVFPVRRGRRRSPAKHGLLAALARAQHLPRRGVLIPQSAVPDDVPESCLGRWHLNAFSAFQTSALANSWETRTNDTRCGFPVPHSFPTAFVFRIPCRVGLGERVRIILTYL